MTDREALIDKIAIRLNDIDGHALGRANHRRVANLVHRDEARAIVGIVEDHEGEKRPCNCGR